jgi:hypothetical protein
VFHDWVDIRAELHDGDDAALHGERARIEAWVSVFHLAGRRAAEAVDAAGGRRVDGVTPAQASQIETATWAPTMSRH